MKKIMLISAILISGCATQEVIKENKFDKHSNDILIKEIGKFENKEKSYEEIEINLIKILEDEKTKNKNIEFNFTNESKLEDLLNVFEFYKINTIVDSKIDTKQRVIINKYDGDLKSLISAVSENTNLTFEQKNEILYITELKNYKIKVVQDKEIIDAVKLELEKLEDEIKELVVSDTAGVFSFKSDYKTFKKIESIIKDINNNTSLINIDLSLINVEIKESDGNGFDWKTLNILANLDGSEMLNNGFSLTSGNRLGITGKNFNFSLVMNALNEYGQTEAIQNTSIKTLSGKEAVLKTTERTPYIDKIEIMNNGEFTEKGFTTSETETGLELKILPYFDKDSKMLNIKVDLKNSSLKGFLNVSNDDFELNQPNTEEQEFNSVVRIRAGETSVIGGLIYYKQNKSGNNIFNEITQSNKKEFSKNALFILIRPTVKSYIYK
ncbi:hypothetical protein C9J48_20405 [Photobacterium profundum]|uniref:Putative type II protein secretion system D protein n=1 Tax=Photobacterium profundum 3TCK TaxID=314280 RepID=Q1Z4Y6_9GAMM|nr:type II protein secretion system protein D [Photobacterium profundum]EAS43485.1 putative type II protein secretion system D protein [Photobacterium profundum 3TCK]PSV60261.1 hypothetical protein C9J48_20405 [Photobacterium profundum]